MRLVVDTNVFISAALKQLSWPGATIGWIGANGGLLKSRVTEQELIEVLLRPRMVRYLPALFLEKVRVMLAQTEPVEIRETVPICRDPKDNKFLELALNGHADLIVSGDDDLLVLESFAGMPIITPATFMQAWV